MRASSSCISAPSLGCRCRRRVRHSDAVMINLVGPEEVAVWPTLLATPGLTAHLYGKAEARAGRKMGHYTTLFPLGSLNAAQPS